MTDNALYENAFIQPGKKVLVVGLGKSGLSAARFLKSLGAEVFVTEGAPLEQVDRKSIEQLIKLEIPYEVGRHSLDAFMSIELICVSPGVPLAVKELVEARKAGIPVFGEMALAAPYLKTPMIAVTGTNGKSTVTTLIGDLCKAAGKKVFVGGNIGTPLTEYLIGPQDADVVVLEVSSFQLDTAGCFRPDIAVLLNISPDHLDRYGSYEEYVRSKFLLFAHQQADDIAILNQDDQETGKYQDLWGAGRKYLFGKDIGENIGSTMINGKVILLNPGKKENEEYDLTGTALEEEPNSTNAMAAITAARLMGCSSADIHKGVTLFVPLSHRMTFAGAVAGVRYYDDSKATNVGAVKAALDAMEGPVLLIAGGRDKGGDYKYLLNVVRQKVKVMILIGEAAEKMATAFEGATTIERALDMNDAVAKAHLLAQKGDAVLLSPACASFDMYKSYGHRGEVFCNAVKKIKKTIYWNNEKKAQNVECVSILSCD